MRRDKSVEQGIKMFVSIIMFPFYFLFFLLGSFRTKSRTFHAASSTKIIPRSYAYNLEKVDTMSGAEFEEFVAYLLKKNGYENVVVTQASGDFGVDITADFLGKKYAFQCKRYQKNIGIKPIQEVYTGLVKYHADVGVVITNSYFTEAAHDLSKSTGVLLYDRDKLISMINNVYKQKRKAEKKNHVQSCSATMVEPSALILRTKKHIHGIWILYLDVFVFSTSILFMGFRYTETLSMILFIISFIMLPVALGLTLIDKINKQNPEKRTYAWVLLYTYLLVCFIVMGYHA